MSHTKTRRYPLHLRQTQIDDRFASVEDKMLTTKEAASYLGISTNALRIHVCRGNVPTFKFRSRLRFRLKDLSTLMENQN